MEILIVNGRKISEVQHDFNNLFRFLKVEFFDAPHIENRALPKSRIIPNSRTIGSCRKSKHEGVITLSKNQTVSEFENGLWKNFGLSAQVFRKSGNLWIETSLSDAWTLERQNREGMEMSNQINYPIDKAAELDITDRDKWD